MVSYVFRPGWLYLWLLLVVFLLEAPNPLFGQKGKQTLQPSASQLTIWQQNGCLQGDKVYPLCRYPNGSLVFGGNDVLDTIRQANVAGLIQNYHYVIPSATYVVGTTLYLSGFSHVEIDFNGSTLIPSRQALKPFDVGGIGIKGVTLTNFRLASSSTYGFASALNILGYSGAPVDGLTFSHCEVAYTSEAAFKLINVGGTANTSSDALRNIRIDHCFIHDTGGEGIKISGAKGVYLKNNVIARVSQVGPLDPGTGDGTVEPVNISVFADTGEIRGNDLSGTPAWNRVPFGTATPASAIYFGGQNFTIADNHIHNSECTYSLCATDGKGSPQIMTILPDGGTAANYVSLGDGIHLDLAQRVEVRGNDISDYSNGIVVEISRSISVHNNSVDKFYSVGMWDNSRLDPGLINPLESATLLTPSSHVHLAVDAQTNGCSGGCVAISIPASTVGNVVCQSATTAFPATNLIPSFQVMSSTLNERSGDLALVLYPTAKCVMDPKAVVVPLPQLLASKALRNVRLPVNSMQDIAFLMTAVGGVFRAGFGSWGIVALASSPQERTLTLGGFGFELSSDTNSFTQNVVSNGGIGLAVQGCGAGPFVTGNKFNNNGSYNNRQDSYYGYFSSLAVFTGTSDTCLRSGTTISHNEIRMDRALSTSGNPYYAPISIDSALSGGAAQFVGLTITSNMFAGPQGTGLLTSHSSVSAAARELYAAGNIGVAP